MFKVVAKEGEVSKGINAMKKKPNTLHQDNSKDPAIGSGLLFGREQLAQSLL
jgi:hypothetical protein